MLESLLLNLGKYGPILLLLSSIFLLRNTTNFLVYYAFGFFLNEILVLVLKGIFKQPRPSEDLKLFNLAVKNNQMFRYVNGYPHNIFGMPSGHSSSMLYSSMFVYLVLKNMNILFVYLLLSINTMTQRVISKNHSISQVFAGAFVGILLGYFIFYMVQQKIMGSLLLKKDDNGPI